MTLGIPLVYYLIPFKEPNKPASKEKVCSAKANDRKLGPDA